MSLQKKVKLETTTEPVKSEENLESLVLETRKVKALEKIANSVDALTVWFEEINKKEWGERIAFYLYEFYNISKEGNSNNSAVATKPNVVPETKEDAAGEIPPPRKIRPKKDIETV
jgi:hypothetical protein